jgi:hypothetical protein
LTITPLCKAAFVPCEGGREHSVRVGGAAASCRTTGANLTMLIEAGPKCRIQRGVPHYHDITALILAGLI